ncbi:hypothetical protein Pcinc_017722 [Petrolisthes cinctipes]|uniref:Uncharacterized protein n=1 Tax=Petrolisthes cinctipes TaxID=88211 RepID=A0AAE1FNQ5_PETCI|nr:hypothetical protein Pcinc_017722 [Petrolisthes cinctipes]
MTGHIPPRSPHPPTDYSSHHSTSLLSSPHLLTDSPPHHSTSLFTPTSHPSLLYPHTLLQHIHLTTQPHFSPPNITPIPSLPPHPQTDSPPHHSTSLLSPPTHPSLLYPHTLRQTPHLTTQPLFSPPHHIPPSNRLPTSPLNLSSLPPPPTHPSLPPSPPPTPSNRLPTSPLNLSSLPYPPTHPSLPHPHTRPLTNQPTHQPAARLGRHKG